jgi:hypothetical protein
MSLPLLTVLLPPARIAVAVASIAAAGTAFGNTLFDRLPASIKSTKAIRLVGESFPPLPNRR